METSQGNAASGGGGGGGGGDDQGPRAPRLGDMYAATDNADATTLLTRYTSGDGVVVGWGLCRDGELGTGSRYNLISPMMIGGHDKPVRVACCGMSSVWLGMRNMLMTMGSGMWGELAVGNPRFNPRVIANEDNMPICPSQVVIPPFDHDDPVIDVAGGFSYFTCISRDGNIFAWGANNYGQCHHDLYNACCGYSQRRTITHEKVVEVACANFSVLARTASGSVYGWGLSQFLGDEADLKAEMGKLGLELVLAQNTTDRYVVPHPVKVAAFEGKRIAHVRAGPWHCAAIDANGGVYTWGLGNNGRLGHGGESDVMAPKIVSALRGKRVIEVACGSFHTVFVTEAGEAYACGDNQAGQCGVLGAYSTDSPQRLRVTAGRKVIHASVGRTYTHLLLETGELVAYGSGLGLGVGMGYGIRLVRCQPMMDNYTTIWTSAGKNHNFSLCMPKSTLMLVLGVPHRGVATTVENCGLREGILTCGAGSGFTLMLSRRGALYSYGVGGWGQLGYSVSDAKHYTDQRVPVIPAAARVAFFSRSIVTYVAAGFSFSMAITEGERVYAWGNNSYGQCGLGVDPKKYQRIPQPREITWLADKEILQVACGSYFALAMRSNGEVFAWGTIECCGVGVEPEAAVCPPHMIMRDMGEGSRGVVLSPVKVPGLSNIIQIATGGWHGMALNAIGEVYTWGIGTGGRLGLGHSENSFTPTKIQHNAFFTRIGGGCYTSYGVDDDAKLYLWGINDKNQLGTDCGSKALTPTHVFDNVRDVALGKYFTLLLTFDSTFHLSGTMEFDARECKSAGFRDTAALPEMIRPETLAKQRTTGLRLYGGTEHVIVLCEKDRIAHEQIHQATRAMRTQTEKIVTRKK